jgi:hypothetical protein
MTYRDKHNRIYPYNTGLKLGFEVDVVITNENSEPIDAHSLLEATDFTTEHSGGGAEQDGEEGHNHFKERNGMVRLYTMQSHCRAYTVDNVWHLLKRLVIELKKRAFLSSVSVIHGEDFDRLDDDKSFVAGGHLQFAVGDTGPYDAEPCAELKRMTYSHTDSSHLRLLDNIRITIGLISLLLDRRQSAEYRRQEYGPFSPKEFRKTGTALTYQTPTNFWLFSPILAHLMVGAGRWAYFLTQNNFENELWEGFESGDIQNAIHHSDYSTGMEIWHLMKNRLQEAGYEAEGDPFTEYTCAMLEMLFDNGIGAIGQGVYKNWRMNRRLDSYHGHFNELTSWEDGAKKRLFKEGHPMFDILKQYLETK